MDNFDLKKFLIEGKLQKEETLTPKFKKGKLNEMYNEGSLNENSEEPQGNPNDEVFSIRADWKDIEGFVNKTQEVFEALGFHVIEDPISEDSDEIGILVSKNPIDVDQYIENEMGPDYNEEEEDDENYNEPPLLNPGGGHYDPADNM